MSAESIKNFFMWCTLMNYTLLIVWCVWFFFAHDAMKRLHDKIIGRQIENFDTLQYAGIALYKLGIVLFNLVPWIALCIVRQS